MQKYQYYGLFLDEKTKYNLINFINNSEYKEYIKKRNKLYIDHCTLLHFSQREEFLEKMLDKDLNYKFHITIIGIGISDKAMAFKVRRSGIVTSCKNKIPHITICTFNNGKPVDSNKITEWYDLDEQITIQTILKRV